MQKEKKTTFRKVCGESWEQTWQQGTKSCVCVCTSLHK